MREWVWSCCAKCFALIPPLSVAPYTSIYRRCPFPVNGSWQNGSVVRDSVYTSSATLEGATGLLNMSVGDVADGRNVDTVTFCAVNLRPHTSWGGRFEVIRMMNGASLEEEDGEGFQVSKGTYMMRSGYPGWGVWVLFLSRCSGDVQLRFHDSRCRFTASETTFSLALFYLSII